MAKSKENGKDPVVMELASRLKWIRENFFGGISQKDATEVFGCESPRTYASYETGERQIPLTLLRRITRMGFDAHWFLTGEGTKRRKVAVETTPEQ